MNETLLDKIIENGLLTLSNTHGVNFRVDNIILGKSIYTMKNCDRIFTDMNICLILLEQGYGFTYFQDDIDFKLAEKYVNWDLRDVLKEGIPLFFKVALADAIYSVINNLNHRYNYKHLTGTLRRKAKLRARELVKDIPRGSSVVLLGAVTEIIDECAKKKINLSVLDLEPSKIGLTIDDNKVEDSSKVFLEKINNAQYVVATGMVFVSSTADFLFDEAKKDVFKLILYMETGSNFGGELTKYGAYKVLSEFFPYYDFNGDTRYLVHKKKRFLGIF